MAAITLPPRTWTLASYSVLINSCRSKSESSSCLFNTCTKLTKDFSLSTNRTPTPFDPLSVLSMIGKSVSNCSNASLTLSGSVIKTVLGCLNPTSLSLNEVLYLSAQVLIVFLEFTHTIPAFSNTDTRSNQESFLVIEPLITATVSLCDTSKPFLSSVLCILRTPSSSVV